MRIVGRLGEAQHRRDACIRAVKDRDPIVPGALGEAAGDPGPEYWPGAGVIPQRQLLGIEFEPVEKQAVELRLEGTDGHLAPVRTGVGGVEGSSAIQQVRPTAVRPPSLSAQPPEQLGEHGHTVDHRHVDDLAPPGVLALQQRG